MVKAVLDAIEAHVAFCGTVNVAQVPLASIWGVGGRFPAVIQMTCPAVGQAGPQKFPGLYPSISSTSTGYLSVKMRQESPSCTTILLQTPLSEPNDDI